MDYAGNAARLHEVFYKRSNTLLASVKAGSEIMENGFLSGGEGNDQWRLSN